MRHITLNTGAKMPIVGLGTWKAEPGEVGSAVEYALSEAGYTHIDCAAVYQNEKEIGASLKKVFSGGKVRRQDVFVTSKLWNSMHQKDAVRVGCEETLSDLGLEYVDLYLMHWGIATPLPGSADIAARNNWDKDTHGYQMFEKVSIRETWEAMQDLVKAGLVKAIGVANFSVLPLIDLLSYADIVPAVNQVELHPYFSQSRLVEFYKHYGIAMTAYSPLGSPGNYVSKGNLLTDPVIMEIAKTHAKTPSQVLIRWAVERETVVIPKSVHPARIKENIDVFDFQLSADNMSAIAALEKHLRFNDPYQWGKVPYFD